MSSEVYVHLIGVDAFIKAMALAGAKIPAALTASQVEEANLAFRRSQAMVPFRFGILKASGRVHPPKMVMGTSIVDISYGGAASAYAYIMHRGIMNGKPINYRTPGTRDHYLSIAVEETKLGMEGRLIGRIEGILKV